MPAVYSRLMKFILDDVRRLGAAYTGLVPGAGITAMRPVRRLGSPPPTSAPVIARWRAGLFAREWWGGVRGGGPLRGADGCRNWLEHAFDIPEHFVIPKRCYGCCASKYLKSGGFWPFLTGISKPSALSR
jgi:hypothetical protein